MQTIRRSTPFALVLLLLLALPGAAVADADLWFEKMMRRYQEGNFSADFTINVTVEQQGASVGMQGQGKMVFGDPTHQRNEMEMQIAMPGSDQGMNMKMLQVMDGEYFWMEMENPMLGGTQVTRMSLEAMGKAAEDAGVPNPMSGGQIDIMKQVEALRTFATFEEKGMQDGLMVLEGVFTEKMRDQMGMAAGMFGENPVVRIAFEPDGMMRWMTMGDSDKPAIRMELSNLQDLGDNVPASTFSYQPPEGVEVTDLEVPNLQGAGSDE